MLQDHGCRQVDGADCWATRIQMDASKEAKDGTLLHPEERVRKELTP